MNVASDHLMRTHLQQGAAASDAKSPEVFLTLVANTAKRIAQLQDMESLMPELVAAVQETFGYDFVSLLLVDPETNQLVKTAVHGLRREEHVGLVRRITSEPDGGVVGWVADQRKPALIYDVRLDKRYLRSIPEARCELAVPLMTAEQVIGVIDVESVQIGGLDERDQFLLETLADQFAIVIENSRLYGVLAQAKRDLQDRTAMLEHVLGGTLKLQEEERHRIARDLHDGLTQLLVGSLYQLDTAQTSFLRSPETSENALRRLRGLLVQCVDEIKCIVHDLRPVVLDDLGLHSAIERYAAQIGGAGQELKVEVSGYQHRLLPPDEATVYRIVQEGLTNAVKHSQAQQILVRLHGDPGSLTVHLEDDGDGFDYDACVGGGLGLLSMQERAASLGTSLNVETAPGQGVSISFTVSVPAQCDPGNHL